MRIVVTIKQVPDPDVPPGSFRIAADGRRVEPPGGVAPIMNGYDANALEAALKLKEAHGGTITAVSVGPGEARDALKRAIAMGADDAVLVEDPALAEADAWLTASALAAAIRRLGETGSAVELVMSGRQASDTDGGQVALGIAELLGLPSVSPVQRIEWRDGSVRVERLTDEGHEVIDVAAPALLAVSSEIGEPRYPPLRGVMMAARAQIPAWSLADLGLADQSPKRTLRRLYQETREARVEMIAGDSASDAGRRLADRLREAKLV